VSLDRRRPPRDQLGLALELALSEVLARLEFQQLRARFLIVRPNEHVAFGDRPALAIANFDDALANYARDPRPPDRLDITRRINDLGSGAARRRSHANLRAAHEVPPAGARYADEDNQ
jgi:hypothetical protein